MACRDLNALLLDLYRCPSEYTQWPVVLDKVCGTLQARSAIVQLLVRGREHAHARWTIRDSRTEAARAIHERYFADEVNPRMRATGPSAWQKLPPVLRDTDLFDIRDPLYADLQQRLAAVQLGFFVSVRIALSDNESLALILHRDRNDRRDFSGRDEHFALGLMPHLRQAVQLTTALQHSEAHASSLNEALNQVRSALLLCFGDGTVHWMNQAAEQILLQRNCLRVVEQRLKATSAQENAQLRAIIADAAQASLRDGDSIPRLLVLRGPTTRSELQVRVQALDRPGRMKTSAYDRHAGGPVLLMFSDPGMHPALPAGLLGILFALSPAESRLAAALCQGQSLSEYAHQQDVSVGTVRGQLKQVMAKTHVSRQSQLIQRLYSSVIAHTIDSN
jgi:DNA-binding CsgD family transcriptional regulator/PAS domain-containing protein